MCGKISNILYLTEAKRFSYMKKHYDHRNLKKKVDMRRANRKLVDIQTSSYG